MTLHGYKQNEILQELNIWEQKSSKEVTIQFQERFRLY
jgi:hypothetical protein